jgi:hypothetical protein
VFQETGLQKHPQNSRSFPDFLEKSFQLFGKNLQMGGSRSRTADPETLPDGR